MGLLRFGIKVGIISSAVYLTIDKGIWKDSETTSELYGDLKEKLKPLILPIKNQIPLQIPELPKAGDMASTAKTAWNKGIMAACLFLIELPELTWDYTKRGSAYAYNRISEELKSLNDAKNEQNNKTSNYAN